MIRTRTATAIAVAVTGLWAQDGPLSVSDPSWKGIEIRFATKIEPSGTRLSGGVVVEPGRVHHIINDAAHKRYFGYDLQLDAAADGQTAQLRIEPLHATRAGELSGGAGWLRLDLPKYPVIPNVKLGDTVALDLLVNPATGQKIVDYLTVLRKGEMNPLNAARDFTLADVEMMLDQPEVSVNGKLAMTRKPGGVSGAVVWLYIADHGRFILSLVPNEKLGFKKSGAVSADGLLFREGETEYRVQCNSRVAPGSGTYNLYVVHEPDWRPPISADFRLGSADKAEWVVGKH